MKKYLGITLVLCLMLSLAACGSKKEENNTADTTADSEVTATPAPTAEVKDIEDPVATIEFDNGAVVKLGTYKGVNFTSLTDDEYATSLKQFLEGNAYDEEVDEAAALGYKVNINYAGYLNGEAFQGGTNDSEAGYDLELGSGTFIPGFEDGLVGAVKGEKRSLNLTFPESYGNSELAGQAVVFEVTVNKVLKTVVPELTDEFIKTKGYESVAAFEEDFRADLERTALETQVGNALLDHNAVTGIPEDEINTLSDEIYSQYYNYAQMYASYFGTDVNTIITSLMGLKSLDDLKAYANDYATGTLTYKYIMKAIAQNEGIEPEGETYMTMANELAANNSFESYEEFLETYGEEEIRDSVRAKVVIDFMIDNAVIE